MPNPNQNPSHDARHYPSLNLKVNPNRSPNLFGRFSSPSPGREGSPHGGDNQLTPPRRVASGGRTPQEGERLSRARHLLGERAAEAWRENQVRLSELVGRTASKVDSALSPPIEGSRADAQALAGELTLILALSLTPALG